MLLQGGIPLSGIDAQALRKFGELPPEKQHELAHELQATLASTPIHSPYRWLLSKSRTLLTQLAKAGSNISPKAVGTHLIPELGGADSGGVYVDEACKKKLNELTEEERAKIFEEFRSQADIRNPSKWLFSKARTRVIDRVTGRTAMQQKPAQSGPDVQREGVLDETFLEVLNLGADEQAIEQVKKLPGAEQVKIVQDFTNRIAQLNSPAEWLFSAARARAIELQAGDGWKRPDYAPISADTIPTWATKHAWQKYPVFGPPSDSRALIAKLTGCTNGQAPDLQRTMLSKSEFLRVVPALDAAAQSKLDELNSLDLEDLLREFREVNGRETIKNPSGWMFSKARTLLAAKARGNNLGSAGLRRHLPLTLRFNPEAEAKLNEFDPAAGERSLQEFHEKSAQETIQNPSGWMFGSASTILAGKAIGQASKISGSRATTLDAGARAKLEELDVDDRVDLLQELEEVSAQFTIRNPSRWLFGKARSMLAAKSAGDGS